MHGNIKEELFFYRIFSTEESTSISNNASYILMETWTNFEKLFFLLFTAN